MLKMTLIMGFLYCKSDLSLCKFRFLKDLYQKAMLKQHKEQDQKTCGKTSVVASAEKLQTSALPRVSSLLPL